MCRHLAYLGPPVTLASLVLDPEHSLYEQSWAPHDMRGGGTVNADGFGLGWYAGGPVARRYRRNVPIWTDDNLRDLADGITSGAVIAAVRNGTDRMPHEESAVAPFRSRGWLFSHNGRIPGYPESTVKLAEQLPVADLLTIDAPVDSALLWALIKHRLHDGADAGEVVASVVQEVEAVAPGSRLNVLLTDGTQLVATTWTHSLWVRRTSDSTTVSSEPFGSGHWDEVPDRSLLVATATTVSITPMEGP
ncbi:ergothioneine biosynthesis protein EgtC [Kribbella albertanoniae]|uniref:Gamma-glutamyl-hercynylcysteine sulfoxide hydrolase n=1 Tax=Kribbella albertanoniae TaxID=1266829 RepID=A0A4R4PCT7_9ACTN|nr:ergothioneine biosynthesis protein EgtC [Kribbella albertanoniae]TDC18242.1 ergothioneine biosynthesis protein EgtC [Kribbella albertanoniae]